MSDGEISHEHSFKILPEILSGPLALLVSILSIINLVSAILIWQDSMFGLASPLICGRCDVSSGNVKFAWKNLLNRNAFRMGVWEISWELSFMKLLYLLSTRFFSTCSLILCVWTMPQEYHILKLFYWQFSFYCSYGLHRHPSMVENLYSLFYKME